MENYKEMRSYEVLSSYYDRFTDDVGYGQWAEYIETHFRRANLQPETILDLACGTGSLTVELAQRGYHIIGVDASEEMLSLAAQRSISLTPRPFFVHQRMEALTLPYQMDACICCLDSINYITNPHALEEAFCRVWKSLSPNGMFIFDINTPKKFLDIAGQSFVREDEDVFCIWQCLIHENLCTYDFDIFENQGKNHWARFKEQHEERIYPTEILRSYLEKAGFEDISVYPELRFDTITGEEHRVFFTARKGREQ